MEQETGKEADAAKSKAKKAKGKEIRAVDDGKPIRLRWDLATLPSSQHKAGLAGLALCVEFLSRKADRKGVCEILEIDQRGLTLEVDATGMQALFDDVYAATLEEVASKTKWAGAEPKRIVETQAEDPKTGKVKAEKRFVYDKVVPRGAMIDEWDHDGEGTPKLWIKLWRDLVWTVLRGVPATREPFNARAQNQETSDGKEAWEALVRAPDKGVELPSTYAIGAQAKSAEDVAIKDLERSRFLLHFWPFVVSIYVPAILNREGSVDFVGFALAVPEVASLEQFVEEWPEVARGRKNFPLAFRPREAVINVAGEGGLDVFRRAIKVLAEKESAIRTSDLVTAVDVFHIEREGNNVRLRDVARVYPETAMVQTYSKVKDQYWNPVFRKQRIANILDDKPWSWGFGRICSTTPKEMTIENKNFCHDCKAALTEVEMKADVPDSEQTLEHLIFKRVQAYVLGKTERKYSLSWAKAQGNPAIEADYREKREKVSREAFLAIRSRTGSDFVAYFTSTLCSIPHHTSEDKYMQVAKALMDTSQVERVRSLTLLALSAVA